MLEKQDGGTMSYAVLARILLKQIMHSNQVLLWQHLDEGSIKTHAVEIVNRT